MITGVLQRSREAWQPLPQPSASILAARRRAKLPELCGGILPALLAGPDLLDRPIAQYPTIGQKTQRPGRSASQVHAVMGLKYGAKVAANDDLALDISSRHGVAKG
jgi:hypothetical protein